jgi:hypothetical protein
MIRFSSRVVVWMLAVGMMLFAACGNPSSGSKKNFDARLNKFKRSLRKADKTLDLMDAMEARKAVVEADYKAGKISEDQARKRLAAIDRQYHQKLSKNSQTTSVTGLPNWAKAIGLIAPEKMVLDPSLSQVTTEESNGEGFNALTLVYKGTYDQAMQQAKRIAGMAGIPLAPEYRTAMEMKQKYGDEILKGAVYMNFAPGRVSRSKYNIAITVDKNGVLTISAADAAKMEQEMESLNPNR